MALCLETNLKKAETAKGNNRLSGGAYLVMIEIYPNRSREDLRMGEKVRKRLENRELFAFSIATVLLLFTAALFLSSPEELMRGMITIVLTRDALVTDYFKLAGFGAAFFNAGVVMGLGIFLVCRQKIPFTGLTMAVLFINAGFALFGKNPVNVLPMLLGTWLYARFHHSGMNRYIYTALFGSCLAPMVTELVYLLPFSLALNLAIAIAVGIFAGFVLPPLSIHTASMHMGYNLFNMGFAGGLFAFVMVCVLQSFGLESNSVFIWSYGRPRWLLAALYLYFAAALLFGLFLNKWSLKPLFKLMQHPGRAVADFVLMDGVPTTLVNMGIIGCLCTTYILLIDGDLSGPVVGAILTAFGFAAFGVHARNYLPVLLGVFLSTLLNHMLPTTAGMQMGAVFAAGLSPITGQFGIPAGIIAGMLHGAVVVCTSSLYGGLNLYNNGFSTGLVAIVLVPTLESFIKGFTLKKSRNKAAQTPRK